MSDFHPAYERAHLMRIRRRMMTALNAVRLARREAMEYNKKFGWTISIPESTIEEMCGRIFDQLRPLIDRTKFASEDANLLGHHARSDIAAQGASNEKRKKPHRAGR